MSRHDAAGPAAGSAGVLHPHRRRIGALARGAMTETTPTPPESNELKTYRAAVVGLGGIGTGAPRSASATPPWARPGPTRTSRPTTPTPAPAW